MQRDSVIVIAGLNAAIIATFAVTAIYRPKVKNVLEKPVHQVATAKKEHTKAKAEAPIIPQKAFKEDSHRYIEISEDQKIDVIATKYAVDAEVLMELNNLSTPQLKKGTKLKLPKHAKQQQKVLSSHAYYTVKSGENPWVIAMKHNMRVEMLLKLNKMDNQAAKRIKPGDKLRIR